MDEATIIRQVKSGNHKAFRQLVNIHQKYAFRLAFRIVCNEEDAKDVVQESFIKVWRNMGSYRQTVKFSTWLYKIVTHAGIDQYRKNQQKKTTAIDESTNHLQLINTGNADNKELASIIEKLAEGLPEKQRMVFVLRDLQGFNSAEVQDILEMTETVVKSNLYHARQSVKEKLTKLLAYERR